MLIALSLLWGGSFFFTAVAVQGLPTMTIVVSRLLLAAVILNIVLRLSGERLALHTGAIRAFFTMGLLNNAIPFSLIVWGQSHLASGVASILNATTPLFTVVAAHWLTGDEKMTPAKLAGISAGLAGVAVMVGTDALQSLGAGVLAQLAILAAALSYAFASIYGRCFRAMNIAPLATATGQVTASSLILLPVMAMIDKPWMMAMPPLPVIASVVALAGLSTALAYILYFRILALAGATNLALVTFLIPVSAIAFGIAFLGEALAAKHLAGMALIAFGLVLIDGRLFNRRRQRI